MREHIVYDEQRQELRLLDQRLLPGEEAYFTCTGTQDIVNALQWMVVRGAPAIGVTAAWGCLLAQREVLAACADAPDWREQLVARLKRISEARPTAVNLAWAVERARRVWAPRQTLEGLGKVWLRLARKMQAEDIAINQRMGLFGAECLKDGDTVMTHCNAGALATAGYGTALGVIRAARAQGKDIRVIANETRPFLQGARLTAWELHADGIPVTVACDNACALLMRKGLVQCVIVGADRIAANGDTANKIGTYGVALLARAHGIPFYVAAPLSTIDRHTASGEDIPIEERPAREVTHVGEGAITPEGVPVFNFAFDVTPAELVSGIITERGVLRPPYAASIAAAFKD